MGNGKRQILSRYLKTGYTVINLPEGAEMEFRVTAVNDGGPGKTEQTDQTTYRQRPNL